MPKHVIFSERAFTALLAETKEKLTTETGGIFLGVMCDDIWYVIETIDPGPKSIFEVAYFEYDGDYVRHLANKINRLYGDRLDVLGLWHRHPGSMDTFSSTDNGTNIEFTELNNGVTISAIVNIDPKFRLTIYTVTNKPLKYRKISYEIGSRKIPEEIRDIIYHKDIETKINSMVRDRQRPAKKFGITRNKTNIRDALIQYLNKSENYEIENIEKIKSNEEDLGFIIDNYIVDESIFCEEKNIPYIFDCNDEFKAELTIGKEDSDMKFTFYMAFVTDEGESKKKPVFIHKDRLYPYIGNMLRSAWEDYRK